MAKPILLVKVDNNVYDTEKCATLKSKLEAETNNEYYVFVVGIGYTNVSLPLFEVFGVPNIISNESELIPESKGDIIAEIKGKDIDFIIDRNNNNR